MERELSSPGISSSSKLAGMAKEFVVGAAGGITQVIIGQPFDIVKVRMQVRPNETAVQVARNIWIHEGVLAFYKGGLPPLLGVSLCVWTLPIPQSTFNGQAHAGSATQISIVYSTFHNISHTLQSINKHESPLTAPQTYLVGGLSGLANSVVSGPAEHIRIRLQTQTSASSQTAKRQSLGAYACIRQIYSQGGIPALYRAKPQACCVSSTVTESGFPSMNCSFLDS